MTQQRAEKKDRYFVLHHYMLKTDAWKSLSAAARAVYLQLGFRYNGANNGKLAFSVRDAAGECNLDKGTASRAFKELVDRGFIEETRHGGLSKKTRIASEWRLTAFKCDLTGSLKTCAFMQRGGSEYSSHAPQKRGPLPGALRPSPVRINSRECPKKLPSLSETTTDDAPECPKQLPTQAVFEPSPVRNNYPHIVYQVAVSSDEAARALAAAAPAPPLTPPPAPPSPLVLWAEFSPSTPRQPASVAAAAPRKPAPDVIVEPIDGVYLVGGRRVEVFDQTARRNVAGLADLHERPARRTVLPSNATPADSAERTVDISTPNGPASSLIH
jgi:hypothetical protein